ncbi:hypothetical protein [Methylobacterium nodulans]|nr:hypothetical protein [Methylobacterium nodulans]
MIVGPSIASAWRLLGRARVRQTVFGRLVVEVCEGRRHGYAMAAPSGGPLYDEHIETRWRPATVYDMAGLDSIAPKDESDLLPIPTPRPWPHEQRLPAPCRERQG